MVVVPVATPVTTPVPEPTETLVLLLVHVPPPASVNAVVEPTHTVELPEIATGNGLTVTTWIVLHPVPNVYVIVDVPPATPETMPVPDPTVATEEVLVVQVPPPPSVNAVVKPAQTVMVPVIAEGKGLTVTTVIVVHPVPKVYVIPEVPAATPETTPVPEPTVATDDVPVVHVPPPASVSAVVELTQTVAVPLMAAGNGLTVTTVVIRHPVPRV